MKKILMYSFGIVGLATAGLIAAPNFAQAQSSTTNTHMGNGAGYGRQQVMETKAKMLGITEAELSTQLNTKTLLQLAEEKGISEDQLHATMEQAAQERWQARGLDRGEIDSRLQTMKDRQASNHASNSAVRDGMRRGMHNQ